MMSGPMMQKLLEDRFKLRIHRETREVPVYALTVAKSGPKLPPFQEGSCTPIDLGRVAQTRQENACRVMVGQKGPLMTLEGPGTSLGDISKLLYLILDRPVVDKNWEQAEDAKLAKGYAATDAFLVKHQKAGLDVAADRLMQNPLLARKLVRGV